MGKREKIKEIILSWTDDTSDIDELLDKDVGKILALIKKDKPPLLRENPHRLRGYELAYEQGKKAQREADIKWMGLSE